MYVLEDFIINLRSFVSSQTDERIDVKLPTTKQSINGHLRFYINGTEVTIL